MDQATLVKFGTNFAALITKIKELSTSNGAPAKVNWVKSGTNKYRLRIGEVTLEISGDQAPYLLFDKLMNKYTSWFAGLAAGASKPIWSIFTVEGQKDVAWPERHVSLLNGNKKTTFSYMVDRNHPTYEDVSWLLLSARVQCEIAGKAEIHLKEAIKYSDDLLATPPPVAAKPK